MLVAQLQQGTSAHALSLSLVLGSALGVIPVFGFITPICAGLATWLRLNVALTLAVLYLWLPLQVILFVPFIRLGELLFGITRLPLAPQKIIENIQYAPWDFMLQIWVSIAGALGAWLLVSVFVGTLLYFVSRQLISRYRA